MIRNPGKIKHAKAWRERLCNQCQFFVPTPFSVGKCGRKDASYPVSILDERALPLPLGCGREGYWFSPRRASDAA